MGEESLDKRLVLAGLDALRLIGGEALVQVLLTQAGTEDFTGGADPGERMPISAYFRYRDTAIDFLQDSFCSTAFETGRILARRLRRDGREQVQALLKQFEHAKNKLPAIGQAAVLGAEGNPGIVRAVMKTPALLVITIQNCPECRDLKRDQPFCFLNQGLITEFAEGELGLHVETDETSCMALGQRECAIEVTVVA